jgi:hypothetical protein
MEVHDRQGIEYRYYRRPDSRKDQRRDLYKVAHC